MIDGTILLYQTTKFISSSRTLDEIMLGEIHEPTHKLLIHTQDEKYVQQLYDKRYVLTKTEMLKLTSILSNLYPTLY